VLRRWFFHVRLYGMEAEGAYRGEASEKKRERPRSGEGTLHALVINLATEEGKCVRVP